MRYAFAVIAILVAPFAFGASGISLPATCTPIALYSPPEFFYRTSDKTFWYCPTADNWVKLLVEIPAAGAAPTDFYTTVRVSGSNATTTGQALVNITGLSIPLAANTTYEFEATLSVQSSSSAGTEYGVQFSAAGATVESQCTGTLLATSAQTVRVSALNTATAAFLTSGATGGILIKGVIAVGANAGNLTIQHLKVTSGTSTVFINSYLKARII